MNLDSRVRIPPQNVLVAPTGLHPGAMTAGGCGREAKKNSIAPEGVGLSVHWIWHVPDDEIVVVTLLNKSQNWRKSSRWMCGITHRKIL